MRLRIFTLVLLFIMSCELFLFGNNVHGSDYIMNKEQDYFNNRYVELVDGFDFTDTILSTKTYNEMTDSETKNEHLYKDFDIVVKYFGVPFGQTGEYLCFSTTDPDEDYFVFTQNVIHILDNTGKLKEFRMDEKYKSQFIYFKNLEYLGFDEFVTLKGFIKYQPYFVFKQESSYEVVFLKE